MTTISCVPATATPPLDLPWRVGYAYATGATTTIIGWDPIGDPAGIVTLRSDGTATATRPGLWLANLPGLRALQGRGRDYLAQHTDRPAIVIVRGASAFAERIAVDPFAATIGVSTWDPALLGVAPAGWTTEIDPSLGVER